MASPAFSSPLASTWNRYRAWADTARQLKISLDRWRLWTLILAVSGAILVTLGQQLGSLSAIIGPRAVLAGKIIGLSGAATIALSTYFAREALNDENVQRWTKCRSAAESLKACTYLYRAGVPPFDVADRDEKLIDRRAGIEDAVQGVELLESTRDDKGFDPSPLSVDGYYQLRIKDQIQFYRGRSDEYQKKMKAMRGVVFWLGAIAVIIGVAAALKPFVAGWTAVIATVTAAIASHVHSQRYQNLIATYQATSRHLETLTDKWVAGGKAEASRLTFIQSCEDTMALENSAWVTQWSQLKQTGR
jgi:SMODS and SLOG-associating 2TM effector domain 1/Protein of unknown function (DUF4231)